MKYLKTKNISKFSISDRTFIVNPYGRITTNSTNSLQIPVGTEEQKPQTSLLHEGMMRMNTGVLGVNASSPQFEVYQAGDWRPVKFKVPSRVEYSNPVAGNDREKIFRITPQPPATIEDGVAWTGTQLMVYVENVFQLYDQNFAVVENPCDISDDTISIDSGTKTITRSIGAEGGFIVNGFFGGHTQGLIYYPGQTITLSGTANSNDGDYTVVAVTDTTIEVNEAINTESAGATIRIRGKSTISNTYYSAGKYIRFFDHIPSQGIYGSTYVTIISGFDK